MLQCAHVAIQAFDNGSTHQAGAAVNLNSAVDDSVRQLRWQTTWLRSLRE